MVSVWKAEIDIGLDPSLIQLIDKLLLDKPTDQAQKRISLFDLFFAYFAQY